MNGNRWSGLRSTLVLIVFIAATCGGDSSGPPKAGPPAAIAVVSGSGQEGESGVPLANALTAKVSDAEGRPLPKVLVSFSISSGGGVLTAAFDTSDAEGLVSTRRTLGSALGTAQVTARIIGVLAPALFTATVKLGPPSIVTEISNVVGNSAGGF